MANWINNKNKKHQTKRIKKLLQQWKICPLGGVLWCYIVFMLETNLPTVTSQPSPYLFG